MQIIIVDKKRQIGSRFSDGRESPAATGNEESNSSAEISALKQMLTQRDNEISIL